MSKDERSEIFRILKTIIITIIAIPPSLLAVVITILLGMFFWGFPLFFLIYVTSPEDPFIQSFPEPIFAVMIVIWFLMLALLIATHDKY